MMSRVGGVGHACGKYGSPAAASRAADGKMPRTERARFAVGCDAPARCSAARFAAMGITGRTAAPARRMVLHSSAVVQGIDLPKGTAVIFNRAGKIDRIELPMQHRLVGLLFAPFARPKHYSNHVVYFHANGRVSSGALAHTQTIEGVRCAGIKIEPWDGGGDLIVTVAFHANGTLKRARLEGAQRVRGIWCADDTDAEFHDDGAIRTGVLARDQRIDGRVFHAGATVELDPKGRIVSVELAKPQKIDGKRYVAGEIVYFRR